MKKIILIAVLILAAGAAGAATNIVMAITNSAPTNPNVATDVAFMQRGAYELQCRYMSDADTALDLDEMTNSVYLVWKPSDALDSSPATKVTGVVMDQTNGTVKVTIKRDMLKSVGEHYFQIVAEDTTTTNRASFFWTATVYTSVDQPADDYLTP